MSRLPLARTRTRTAACGCLAVGALALTGCGPDATEPPAPSGSSAAQAPVRGPLDELLVQLDGGDPLQAADPVATLVEQTRIQEERVAACMLAAGFEYDPQVPAAADVVISEGPTRGTREYVEQYGYGAADPPPDESGGASWEITSSNPEYVATLSEAGRAAYDEALWGPATETSADGGVTREGGCVDKARTQMSGGDSFTALRDEAYAFLTAAQDDPAFSEIDTAWSRCMADQGYTYATPVEAEASFYERNYALVDPETHMLDAAGARALADEELPTALADLECREQLDYVVQHAAIAAELQQEWMDLHRAELDAWVESAATSGGADR